MPEYRLSQAAAEDLAEIADYTIQRFGIQQARQYRDGLHRCLLSLAESPAMGRKADHIAPKLRRFEHKSHVIFYRPGAGNILIVRILHSSMGALRHF